MSAPLPRPRRYVVNSSRRRYAENDAEAMREAFVDRPVEKEETVSWKWPKRMREVGECVAVMYTSDKWKDEGDYKDYKHVAEGPQEIYFPDGFLRDYDADPSGRKKLEVCGPYVDLNGPMPDAFAVLAPVLGVQVCLYEEDEAGELVLTDDGYRQVDIDGAKLGGARHPKTREAFLIIYDSKRVLALVTGDALDVERDGIVG